jgi:hypothetical protein
LVEPVVPVVFAPVLDAMEGSDISEFFSCDDYLDALNEDLDERTVSHKADKTNNSEHVATSSKPSPWNIGSDEMDLQKWQSQKRRVPKPTYSESLKGSAPGSSAKLGELLKFVKRKNIVRR